MIASGSYWLAYYHFSRYGIIWSIVVFVHREYENSFYIILWHQSNIVAGQGVAAASGLIMFVPNLILFIILQSNVMNTMAYSGMK